jgi:hypothetical protein
MHEARDYSLMLIGGEVMFLERKFSRRGAHGESRGPSVCPGLPQADWSTLPELVYDVVCNIQLLLASRRRYSHVLSDFGLSPSHGEHGQDAQLERLQAELPATLARYERRFVLEEVAFEVDDAGAGAVKVSGQIPAAAGGLTFRFGLTSRKIVSLEFAALSTG